MWTDIIGWCSTAILVITVGRQAYTQWKERSTAGTSRWLFIGQFAASLGLVIYSYLLDKIVFVVSNLFLLAIASVGQWLSCVTGNAKNSTRKRWREWAA